MMGFLPRYRGVAISILIVAVVGTILSACGPSTSGGGLPALGAKMDDTSVSGISSGAYMAGQFEMAHAKLVTGAAIIAGGPYGCSQSIFADTLPAPGTEFLNLSKAVNGCMLDNLSLWGVADPKILAEKAKTRAEHGEIDPIADVVTDRVYLFTGSQDHTVVPAIVKAAAEFYADLGVPQANIKLVDTLPAGHAFVTEDEGAACDRTGEPYVVDCDYDQAGALLSHIYGKLEAPSKTPQGKWIEFDQRPYTKDLNPDGMADTGVVYIPESCRTQPGCRIHIAYHGCAQNREKVGDAFVKETGFARWADTNRLIVLYPQTQTTPFNPQGCWDWWGYTGSAYLTRKAPQIIAVYRMIEALGRPTGA
ncbi:MAG: PHB depolymerase family esterase [Hyphomicrobium sp.]